MTSLSGTSRRIAALGAALVLAATVFVTPVAAAKPTCHVENVASHTSFRSLQAAVQAAPSGAELRVKGTCVGNTTIVKDLAIRGKSNGGFGPATLDGAGAGRVLTIQGGVTVTLDGLLVTNGNATFGGGIATVVDFRQSGPERGDRQSTRSSATTPRRTAAVVSQTMHGKVTLIDTAVRDNSAVTGGGIHNSRDQGDLSLKRHQLGQRQPCEWRRRRHLHRTSHGSLDLYDESSVHHNSAGGTRGRHLRR